MITWREANTRAAVLAAEVHADLDLDLAQPIDVFHSLQRMGIVVAFAPLRSVSGVYMPRSATNPRAGVLLNAAHPRSRQRYTAAHELGHHVFGHKANVDGDVEEALQRGNLERWSDDEKEAEAFGAWFLMPRRLLRVGLSALGIKSPQTPADVYALSLWLGTSYTATARQLSATRILSASLAEQFARVAPRDIKLALTGRLPLDDMRNDVWWFDRSANWNPVNVRPGDRMVLSLPEDVSTGFTWRFNHLPPGFVVVADSFDGPWNFDSSSAENPDESAGGQRNRKFVIDIGPNVPANVYHVAAEKSRDWGDDVSIDQFELLVAATPALHGVQLPEEALRIRG